MISSGSRMYFPPSVVFPGQYQNAFILVANILFPSLTTVINYKKMTIIMESELSIEEEYPIPAIESLDRFLRKTHSNYSAIISCDINVDHHIRFDVMRKDDYLYLKVETDSDKDINNALDKMENYLELIQVNLEHEILSMGEFEVMASFDFHPDVIKSSDALLKNGHYRQCILEAYIALIETVQTKAGQPIAEGSKLMQRVFSPENPILKLSDDQDEQRGFMWMFTGAVMGIRNAYSHKTHHSPSKKETMEWLAFASALFRLLDGSQKM